MLSIIDTVITLALPSVLIVIFNVFILLKIWRFLGEVEEEVEGLARQVSDVTDADPAEAELVSQQEISEPSPGSSIDILWFKHI